LGQLPSTAADFFSTYASFAATLMLLRTLINDIVPESLKNYIYSSLDSAFHYFIDRFFRNIARKVTVVIDEEAGISRNQIYDAAEIYLRTVIDPDAQRLKANKTAKQKSINLSMEKDQEIVDNFRGIEVKWKLLVIEPEDKTRFMPIKRYFELTFDKSKKSSVIEEYLPFVLSKSQEIKANERAVKLYTRDSPFDNDEADEGGGGGYWGCINLDHPVTFEKLAMDPDLKRAVIDDLDRFVRRKEYYRRVGKAWKRGYLLYGPPGTGKSSLIAAIANYLKFDVYDLELTSVYDNRELRKILLCTTNKSILVIEDIDCSVPMHDRSRNNDDSDENSKITLSGVLNFIDGLWSTCGDERIIIFTTNHKEKLDPALLRPGRMDMHIHMGYCTPAGFDTLAQNYIGIVEDHSLFPEIKRLIGEIEVSPAEIAEQLMRNDDADLALDGLLVLLQQKKKQQQQQRREEDGELKEKEGGEEANGIENKNKEE
ncbi:hypothetical protein M569_14151, partial [Genlisea aurea]